MFNPLSAIVDSISSFVKNRQEQSKIKLEHKNKITQIKQETELAKVNAQLELAKTSQSQDYNLDKIAMENMEKSYKDEFILVIFLIPFIMSFIPPLQPHALKGFEVIAKMPEWYRAVIIGMIVVIYGMRGMLKAFLSKNIFSSKPQNNG